MNADETKQQNQRMLMTLLILAMAVLSVSAAAAFFDGGIGHLLSVDALITVFSVSLPFFVLWAAAKNAKGMAVPGVALAISFTFILLDVFVSVGPGSRLNESVGSIVMGAITSAEIILPLLMVVGAIVSQARWEGEVE